MAKSWTRVSHVPDRIPPLPDFTRWPSFPFEGDMRVKPLADPVAVEPPRSGEDAADCVSCGTPDDEYIWVSDRWRVRAMDRPTGLPVVLILECRSHLDLGDLPNLLAAELGVMTVRLERAIRSLDGVARVHVNRWGDGSAHLHMWFLARPYGRLQLRGTFLSLWDDILPVVPENLWRENLALVAAWLGEFGGRAIAEPPHIAWQSPSTISDPPPISIDADAEPTRAPRINPAHSDDSEPGAQASATVTPAEAPVREKASEPSSAPEASAGHEVADPPTDQRESAPAPATSAKPSPVLGTVQTTRAEPSSALQTPAQPVRAMPAAAEPIRANETLAEPASESLAQTAPTSASASTAAVAGNDGGPKTAGNGTADSEAGDRTTAAKGTADSEAGDRRTAAKGTADPEAGDPKTAGKGMGDSKTSGTGSGASETGDPEAGGGDTSATESTTPRQSIPSQPTQ
ncbi:hypothetical protein KRMM14A1259_43070 [Krasilnikovia sp. MM14-A1259]